MITLFHQRYKETLHYVPLSKVKKNLVELNAIPIGCLSMKVDCHFIMFGPKMFKVVRLSSWNLKCSIHLI